MWPTSRIFYLCGRRRRCREWEMQLTNVDSCLFFLAAGEETQTSAVSSDTHQGHPAAPLVPAGSYVWHLIQKEEEKTGPMWRTRRYTISDSDANWTFKKASSFLFFLMERWGKEFLSISGWCDVVSKSRSIPPPPLFCHISWRCIMGGLIRELYMSIMHDVLQPSSRSVYSLAACSM